jgi:hypothetical protein
LGPDAGAGAGPGAPAAGALGPEAGGFPGCLPLTVPVHPPPAMSRARIPAPASDFVDMSWGVGRAPVFVGRGVASGAPVLRAAWHSGVRVPLVIVDVKEEEPALVRAFFARHCGTKRRHGAVAASAASAQSMEDARARSLGVEGLR